MTLPSRTPFASFLKSTSEDGFRQACLEEDQCDSEGLEAVKDSLGCMIQIEEITCFQAPRNQIQEHLDAHALIKKRDHLFDAEASLLASGNQLANRPK